MQFLADRERTQDEFFHTFNALHEARKQIVLTSDKVPKDITGLEERLRNRFEWGLIADIQPPDMETRVAILEKKAEIEGLDLPPDVAIFLASHIDSNVRELEGSLTRLSAVASLSKTSITVDFARSVLRDLLRERRAHHDRGHPGGSLRVTTRFVSAILSSQKRTRNIAGPRQVAMYLARKLTTASYPAIGERFGNRDHSTVIHAHDTIGARLTADANLRAAVEQIERDTPGTAVRLWMTSGFALDGPVHEAVQADGGADRAPSVPASFHRVRGGQAMNRARAFLAAYTASTGPTTIVLLDLGFPL